MRSSASCNRPCSERLCLRRYSATSPRGCTRRILEKELDKLLPTNKKITEESVLTAKASLHAFAEGHELLPSVCACRMATYYYRGVGLPRRTDEFAEDASLGVSFVGKHTPWRAGFSRSSGRSRS